MLLGKSLTAKVLIFLGQLADEAAAYSTRSVLARMFCQGWYRKSTFQDSICQLLAAGQIERRIEKGEVFYQLTSRGWEGFKEKVSFWKLAEKPWDGFWRLVIFDITEERRIKRDRLRKKLKELGFAQWQRSVYLTPHSFEKEMREFLKAGEFEGAVCLVASGLGKEEDRQLAFNVWNLGELEEEYLDFCKEAESLVRKQGKILGQEVKDLWFRYNMILEKEPFLPKALLPRDWPASRAKETWKKVLGFLAIKETDLEKVTSIVY